MHCKNSYATNNFQAVQCSLSLGPQSATGVQLLAHSGPMTYTWVSSLVNGIILAASVYLPRFLQLQHITLTVDILNEQEFALTDCTCGELLTKHYNV